MQGKHRNWCLSLAKCSRTLAARQQPRTSLFRSALVACVCASISSIRTLHYGRCRCNLAAAAAELFPPSSSSLLGVVVLQPPGRLCWAQGERARARRALCQWHNGPRSYAAEQMPKIDHNQQFFGPDIAELAINTRSNCQIPHHAHTLAMLHAALCSPDFAFLSLTHTRARICKSPAVLRLFLLYVFASQSVFLALVCDSPPLSHRYCQCLHTDVKFFNLVVGKPTNSLSPIR